MGTLNVEHLGLVVSPRNLPQRVLTPSPRVTSSLTARRRRRKSSDVGDVVFDVPPPPPRSIRETLLAGSDHGTLTHEDVSNIQIVKLLGCGGFGAVYQGLMGDVPVAVKRLHARGRAGGEQVVTESYRAELLLLTLRHPHVVAGLCAAPAGRDHPPVLVMEYVSDVNLAHVIDDVTQTLDLRRRLRFARQLSDALAYVHSRCVVHLDVKPSNILVGPGDCCKLGDFGCSQVVAEEADLGVVTPTGRSLLTGTWAYRAPELLRGDPPSRKADIYSLGVTLWQMLSRQVPYGSEHQHVVIFGVVAYNLRPAMPAIPSPTTSGNGCWTLEEMGRYGGYVEHPLEEMYREVVVQCWDVDREVRPSAGLLGEVFEAWMDAY